jgi:hypothetical protein
VHAFALVRDEAQGLAVYFDHLAIRAEITPAPEEIAAEEAIRPAPCPAHGLAKCFARDLTVLGDLQGDAKAGEVAVLDQRQERAAIFDWDEPVCEGHQGKEREDSGKEGHFKRFGHWATVHLKETESNQHRGNL